MTNNVTMSTPEDCNVGTDPPLQFTVAGNNVVAVPPFVMTNVIEVHKVADALPLENVSAAPDALAVTV